MSDYPAFATWLMWVIAAIFGAVLGVGIGLGVRAFL